MSSNYSAELTTKGSVLIADPRIGAALDRALSALKERLWFKTGAINTFHSQRYVRMQIAGERPITLAFFLSLLAAVERLGDREEQGRGREWVCRILDALARPFGLKVVPRDEPTTPKEEVAQALSSAHRELDNLSEILQRNGGRLW